MSRFIKTTLTGFKTFNLYQRVSIIVLFFSVPLIIALSVNAISGPGQLLDESSIEVNVEDVNNQDNESSQVTSASSSSEIEEDVKIILQSSSVEEDLEVKIVNEKGVMVVGPEFVLNVKSDETHYNKDWNVNDGFLKLTKLEAGKYTVSIEALEGYIMPDSIEIEVQEKVAYEEQDVSDKVVDESEVDASKEDHDYGSNSGSSQTPPPLVDTVGYVESTSKVKEVEVDVKVDYYKPKLASDGTIALADNSSSGYYPELDSNGYLVGAYKQEVAPANMSMTYYSIFPKSLTYNLSQLNIIGVNEGTNSEGEQTEATPPPPTDAPVETATPSPEPTPTPSPEATPTPSPEPTATATSSPQTTPTPSPEATSTAEPTESPEPTENPDLVKTPVEIFNEDGTIKTELKLSVEKVTVTEKETKEVTYYYGWQDQDGKRYYYDSNGNKVTGTQIIKGVSYVFDSNGVLQNGEIIGLDVSKWQTNIDWNVVKNSGVDWVIIRVGYRGYSYGAIVEDPLFDKHIQGAKAAGLKVGIYFYTQAITTQEAVEEASFAVQQARKYGLDLPIFFDTEATGTGVGRADYLSTDHRTAITKAFCETVENSGFQAGVYASKSWFYYQLHYSQISQYDIWLAHYTTATDFNQRYEIWQYTGTGTWPGVAGHVDINIAYKHY